MRIPDSSLSSHQFSTSSRNRSPTSSRAPALLERGRGTDRLSDLLIPTKSIDGANKVRSAGAAEHPRIDRDSVPGSVGPSTASAAESVAENATVTRASSEAGSSKRGAS